MRCKLDIYAETSSSQLDRRSGEKSGLDPYIWETAAYRKNLHFRAGKTGSIEKRKL